MMGKMVFIMIIAGIILLQVKSRIMQVDVVTLIFMGQGKFVECEVQGYASDSSEFKFDPTGWHKPTYSTLTSASCKFALNEYNTIEELMKGDYYVDINKYDPYDWHTWSTHLE